VFTGIIEEVAVLARVEALGAGKRLALETDGAADLAVGDSVALDGACMTVVEVSDSAFAVDVSAESLRRTTLGDRRVGDRVNVERSMRLGGRLGGLMITGHVDGSGSVVAIRPEGESSIYTFGVGEELARLMVEKGSVAVDGISLTCFNLRGGQFEVAVIPHTAQATTLGTKRVGDRVNIENDLLAKYVEKLLIPARAAKR
jgi:riboflavin synthase